MPFSITDLPKTELADDDFIMSSARSHDQFNTTIYGMEDRYRGIHNERRVIFMNINDMEIAGFKPGEKVDPFNFYDGVERVARPFYHCSL
jgi:anaerobic selenocysteine-containing dehydrogenase